MGLNFHKPHAQKMLIVWASIFYEHFSSTIEITRAYLLEKKSALLCIKVKK